MLFYLTTVFFQTLVSSGEVRPVWNIGHMVNSLKQIDEFLNLGANALEADFTFDENGIAKWTYHGLPCDCFRNCKKYADVNEYLRRVRELTSPDSPNFRSDFVLLQIDLKISQLSQNLKFNAGSHIALKLITYLWKGPRAKSVLWILLSFPQTSDSDFVSGFLQTLRVNGYQTMEEKIGWDISGNEELNAIKEMYVRLGISSGVWQSDGISNCLPRSTSRLLDAIYRRDWDPEWEFLDKVYYWTLDKESTMRQALRMGVDAIITNHPDRFVSVLAEEEFLESHRLATIRDSPWKKVRGSKRPNARIMQAADPIFYECNLETEAREEEDDDFDPLEQKNNTR